MKGTVLLLGLLQWHSHVLMVFVLSSVPVEFGYHPLKCLYSLCSCCIRISQKYLKINGLGQFLSSLEKGAACFSHRVLLLFIPFFVCVFVWVKICQGKAQQKKITGFCSETEWNYEQLLLLCDLDLAALKVVTSLVVPVKIGCCRKAWTRENGSSTLTKNNPRKACFSEQELSPQCQAEDFSRKLSIAGKCLSDFWFNCRNL